MDERDCKALAVAYLTTINPDITQEQIQRELRIGSQAEVSRLFKHAKKSGWVTWTMNWPTSISEFEIEQIKRTVFQERNSLHQLVSSLARARRGVPIKDIYIVPLTVDGIDSEISHLIFARIAAPYVTDLIYRSRFCGVAWGRTVTSLIASMQTRQKKPDSIFIPVSGEPLNYKDHAASPSTSAQRLTELFGSKNNLSLRGIPARIPKDMDEDADVIRRLVHRSHDYRAIFVEDQGGKPLIRKMDMILTGIGDASTSKNDPWFQEISELERPTNLRQVTAGNIGGVWIPRDPTDKYQDSLLKSVNSRWLGMQEEHLRETAARAQSTRAPGVVVVAIEPEKAEIVHRSIGMINHLIVSEPLARTLLGRCAA